jgi:hypothetical protein
MLRITLISNLLWSYRINLFEFQVTVVLLQALLSPKYYCTALFPTSTRRNKIFRRNLLQYEFLVLLAVAVYDIKKVMMNFAAFVV